jgi:hypothetical protein
VARVLKGQMSSAGQFFENTRDLLGDLLGAKNAGVTPWLSLLLVRTSSNLFTPSLFDRHWKSGIGNQCNEQKTPVPLYETMRASGWCGQQGLGARCCCNAWYGQLGR